MKRFITSMLPIFLFGILFLPIGILADDKQDSINKILDNALDDALKNVKRSDRADSLRYKNPNPTAKDTAEFVAIYRELAEGLPWAAFEMGQIYGLGIGVPKDSVEAFKWYLKAADWGERRAMRSVGIAKLQGWGTAQDIPGGLDWLDKASTAGNTQAAAYLGDIYFRGSAYTTINDSLAIKYLYMASDSGDLPSQKSLADLYIDKESRWQNDSMAARWAEYLAAKGDARYQDRAGYFYANGIGVVQNDVKAGNYFFQAAKQEYAFSESALASMFYLGWGTEVNYVQSYAWAARALKHGDTIYADELIDSLNLVMTPAQKDSAATIEPDWDPITEADIRREQVKQLREKQRASGKTRPGATVSDSTTTPDSTATPRKTRRPR